MIPSTEPQLQLTEQRGGKPLVRWFLSYAHADKVAAQRLRQKLELQLGNSKPYCFEPWSDHILLPGEAWFEQITDNLNQAHLGVLLMSHAFLRSEFIQRHELRALVGGLGEQTAGKRVVPVLLEPLDFATTDLKGLERRQVFADDTGCAFSERRGVQRDLWIGTLVKQIHRVVAKYAKVSVTP